MMKFWAGAFSATFVYFFVDLVFLGILNKRLGKKWWARW